MLRSLELATQIFRIYLTDDSEKANLTAIGAIARGFKADSGVLFFVDATHQYRFCLAGSQFSIEIPESRWKECVQRHLSTNDVTSFDNWSPPGLDTSFVYWISAPLYSSGSALGFVLIGRNEAVWSSEEIDAFKSTTKTISEIVEVRYKRECESHRLRETEARLSMAVRKMSAFFENSRDMIYSIDSVGRFRNINRAGIQILGLSEPKDVIGHSLSEIVINADVHDFFDQKISEDGFVADLEIVLNLRSGKTLYCLENAHAFRAADGSIKEIQGSIKDITDRIKNERNMWTMNFELVDLNLQLSQAKNLIIQQEKLASIGQLAAGIAHEINNPLGFLKSNHAMLKSYFETILSIRDSIAALHILEIEAISKEKDVEYVFEEASHIFAQNDDGFARIKNIVSNLMSFSRSESNTGFSEYDVNQGIESTLVVAWNEIKYVAEVAKEFDGIPHIPARGGEINQVILNVLVNAAQAIGSQKRGEKGLISIKTFIEGAYVVILIADDGPGIPQSIISRIFDPFFTTKEPGKGTGLGLSISYDIVVNKHNGRFSVASEPGHGARFRIDLPISRPE